MHVLQPPAERLTPRGLMEHQKSLPALERCAGLRIVQQIRFRSEAQQRGHNRMARRILHHQLDQRSEEHTSELQSLAYLVCRLLLEKKKKNKAQQRPRVSQISD